MATNHCASPILHCPCEKNPFSNLSSERPDPASFFSFKFTNVHIPLGAPNPWWGTTVAVSACTSAVSQQDADDCAGRGGTNAILDTETTPDGIPIPIYGNQAQSCQVACPTGFQPFIYTVPAGTVLARSQAEADALAASYCLSRAQQHRVCVPTPSGAVTIQVVQNIFSLYDLSDDGIVTGIDVTGLGRYWKNGVSTVLDFGGGAGIVECANNGRVGGASYDAGFNQFGLWDVAGSLPVNAGADVEIKSLNTSGVGAAWGSIAGTATAFRYTPGVGLLDLGNLGIDAFIGGQGLAFNSYFSNRTISNAGQIAVSSRNAFPMVKACRWSGGVLTNISPAFCPALNPSCSVAINASGNIVGGYIDAAGFRRGFLWNGAAVDFGMPITDTYAWYLNDSNEVCGSYLIAGNPHGFRWNSTDGIVALPEFPGTIASQPYSLNNSAWIVGYMFVAASKAFLYKTATAELIDLYTLLPAGSDWSSLEQAYCVNNNKQIAGFGTYLGTPGTCFLMTLP